MQIANELIVYGPLGIFCAILIYAVVKLWRELADIRDAQYKAITQMVEAVNEITRALEQMRESARLDDTLQELKALLKEKV